MMRSQEALVESVDRIGGRPVPERAERIAPMRHVDVSLVVTSILLAVFGAVMVFSASAPRLEAAGEDPTTLLRRHLLYAVAGVLISIVVMAFDYRHLASSAPLVYCAAVVSLIAVLTPLGTEVSGATRWIEVGSLQVQPSEFAKAAVLIALAAYLARRKGDVRARHVMVCCVLAGFPASLIFLQPDLGTMVVFAALFALFLLIGGAKPRHFAALAGAAVLGVLAVANLGLVRAYQVERVTAFLDPAPDVRSTGYNLTQSKIAIASGGLNGKGLGAVDTQTGLAFVPEQHTDFIFTAVGEQLGFMGSAALLALFAFLIWRALRIAAIAGDVFGTLLAAGAAVLWAVQVFVNVGMTMGIMPITGTPLPFISFGGSSLLTNFLVVGLLANVHMRRLL